MTKTAAPRPATITPRDAEQIERANATGLPPVVFVHGLWLLPSRWVRRSVLLSWEEFRYGCSNALSDAEGRELYET
jgi:pimeloyl-ACP methyl ester carboxylesterase